MTVRTDMNWDFDELASISQSAGRMCLSLALLAFLPFITK